MYAMFFHSEITDEELGLIPVADDEAKKVLPDTGIPILNGERVWLGVDPDPQGKQD